MKTEGEFSSRKTDEIPGKNFGDNNKKLKTNTGVKYQCPMKCHGEEMYDEQGICPDSKMEMIPVGGGYIFY